MGGTQSKNDHPNANVINDVIVEENVKIPEDNSTKIMLFIITLILVINMIMKLYKLHNNKLKRKYLNRAASVASIV